MGDDRAVMYLGERYGWAHTEQREGTNYITTGGGMALSGPALAKLMACNHCTCRQPNQPDDMALGGWFQSLGVAPVHEEGFHQSEPHNYHPEVLMHADEPVSFHRFAVRLPSSASTDEKMQARRENWRQWATTYFKKRDLNSGETRS